MHLHSKFLPVTDKQTTRRANGQVLCKHSMHQNSKGFDMIKILPLHILIFLTHLIPPISVLSVLGALSTACESFPEIDTHDPSEILQHEQVFFAQSSPERSSGFTKKKLQFGQRFMAVTANQHATKAAHKILSKGGSAIDAMIAAQLVLGLVEPQSSGIGGGGFLVYYDAKTKKTMSFDARETAPLKSTPELFMTQGDKPMKFFDAVIGGRSVGTPGLVKLMEHAHQRFGRLAWRELFDDAITMSKTGFKVSKRLNHLIGFDLSHLKKSPTAYRYLTANGEPLPVGHNLINLPYAKTLETIRDKGASPFYFGNIRDSILSAVKNTKNPGGLSKEDFSNYKIVERPPLCGIFMSYNICGMAPPSSGPFSILQTLKIFEQAINNLTKTNFVSQANKTNTVKLSTEAALHVFGEAMRLSYADRDVFISDPDFSEDFSSQLLSSKYIETRASLIHERALDEAISGRLTHNFNTATSTPELPSTTHMSIVDQYGNIVSLTSSIENVFGSRIMASGFFLNNQLTDFSFSPIKNGKKVSNRVEPGKRPRSSMAPVIVFDAASSEPTLVIGSPGGSRIIGYVAKTLFSHLYFKETIDQAINSRHFLNRYGTYEIETRSAADSLNLAPLTERKQPLTDKTIESLKTRGHKVVLTELNSGLHAIKIEKSRLIGAVDSRREGLASGE